MSSLGSRDKPGQRVRKKELMPEEWVGCALQKERIYSYIAIVAG